MSRMRKVWVKKRTISKEWQTSHLGWDVGEGQR